MGWPCGSCNCEDELRPVTMIILLTRGVSEAEGEVGNEVSKYRTVLRSLSYNQTITIPLPAVANPVERYHWPLLFTQRLTVELPSLRFSVTHRRCI
ncbi:hypothetical protein J6590_015995 [Homalodisca vitripennis]|nr:hypothetical protein J6590_015995 [Homalodisca vitripennis]